MGKILIADDDKEIAILIAESLNDEGFETVMVHDGNQVLQKVQEDPSWSIVILDIMMPGADGLEVCRRIRDTVSCPILFVTAKKRVLDTMIGLEMGGDDYITKPFVVEELVARVKAHLRRELRTKQKEEHVYQVGDLKLYKERYEVYLCDTLVEFSTREFQVLAYFCENVGKVVSKEMIYNHIWGQDYGDIGAVAVHIKNIRDKIDKDNALIKTVWGVGYKLVKPKESI